MNRDESEPRRKNLKTPTTKTTRVTRRTASNTESEGIFGGTYLVGKSKQATPADSRGNAVQDPNWVFSRNHANRREPRDVRGFARRKQEGRLP